MADSPLKPETTDAPIDKEQDSIDNDATGQKVKKRRLGVDPSLIISDGRSKRRKTPSPEPEVKNEQEGDPKDKERAEALGREIYKKIMDSTQNGENMAEPFVKLPSKRQFPDYYEMIKHPMCLETVKQKLDKQEYESLKEVVADLGQIFNNAKRYNLKDSHLFQWAKKLHKMTRTFYNKVTQPDVHHSDSEDEPAPGPSDTRRGSSAMKLASASVEVEEEDVDMGGGPSNASMDGSTMESKGIRRRGTYMKDGPTVYKLVKPVLKAIRDARSRDGMNREISLIFENLPDKRDLPDYYAAIKNPISLSEIEERMLARRYDTWEEFFEQVELMCNNAMQYNEDESDVFRDAQQIMAILETHRNEIKYRLAQPTIPTQKFRLKPAPSASTPSRPPHNAYLPSNTPGAQSPYPSAYPSASPYPAQTPSYPVPAPSASPAPHRPYLAPLPPNVVTDDIVTRLPQYPQHEQQAWASSLQPVQMSQYRQILANQEGRRRLAAGQTGLPLADSASSGRAPGAVGAGSVQPFNMAQRSKPPLPMIKHLDFAFAGESITGEGRERHTIRLHNLKGVITHALIIGAETAEIEITAYIATPPPPQPPTEPATDTPPSSTVPPEVSLRVNGNPGSLAKFVYAEQQIGDEEPVIDQQPVDRSRTKPVGMKWSLPIAHSRMETKLEVVSTKAGVTELCAVYITRQF